LALQKDDFSSVSVSIGSESIRGRRLVEGILRERGVSTFQEIYNTKDFEAAIIANETDLFVCDASLPTGELDKLMERVRNGWLGPNPFFNILVLIYDTTPESVKKYLNAGADSIIQIPFSKNQLLKHFMQVIDHRKPFVVTSDYIGPDRDRTKRPGEQKIPNIKVPNLISEKIYNSFKKENHNNEVLATMAIINEEKMSRHAFQVGWLADKMVSIAENSTIPTKSNETRSKAPEEVARHFGESLLRTANDMNLRIVGLKDDHTKDLCISLLSAAEKINESPPFPDQRDVGELVELAIELKTTEKWYGPDGAVLQEPLKLGEPSEIENTVEAETVTES